MSTENTTPLPPMRHPAATPIRLIEAVLAELYGAVAVDVVVVAQVLHHDGTVDGVTLSSGISQELTHSVVLAAADAITAANASGGVS